MLVNSWFLWGLYRVGLGLVSFLYPSSFVFAFFALIGFLTVVYCLYTLGFSPFLFYIVQCLLIKNILNEI